MLSAQISSVTAEPDEHQVMTACESVGLKRGDTAMDELDAPAGFVNVSHLKLAGKEVSSAREVHIRPATTPGDLWVMVHAESLGASPPSLPGAQLSFETRDGTEVEVNNSTFLHGDSEGHFLLKARSLDGKSPLKVRKPNDS